MSEDWLDLPPQEFMELWYAKEYSSSTYGSTAGRVQSWMHSSLERGYSSSTVFTDTLELGGNVGEHIPFVRHDFSRYVLSDLNARDVNLSLIAPNKKIEFAQANAENIPFADASFDRVLHTCLLHHVNDPEAVLEEIRRLLKPGGTADLFLASDPGTSFRLARWLGPIRSAKRKGLGDVKRLVDARDHKNHVGALRRLIHHHFRNDSVQERSYPMRGLTWNSSLWFTYRVTRN